jgi:hypothetical protein
MMDALSSAAPPEPAVALERSARPSPGRIGRLVRRLAYVASVFLTFLVAAEATARIDDWLRQGVPLLATPNKERDLYVRDSAGQRGRPHGRFQKWSLNEFGFRGPEIAAEPTPGRVRVMILGSSESFGLYESEGKEYPAQLAKDLGERYEVINAALPGMTVRSTIRYWERWASRFKPEVVVLYPNPGFYLADGPPTKPKPGEEEKRKEPPLPLSDRSRLVQRLRVVFDLPPFLQKWRDERFLAGRLAGKGADWIFREPPRDRAELFISDLAELIDAVEAQGARVILMTHAIRVASPPRTEDRDDLLIARTKAPRVTDDSLVGFEKLVNREVQDLGKKRGLPVIDLDAAMSGKRPWFGDLVHFTDDGATVVARLVAEQVRVSGRRDALQ